MASYQFGAYRLAGYALSSAHTSFIWFAACAGLVSVIAVSDWATGYELSLSILYLVPIFITTWVLGRDFGIAMSVLSLITWLVSDYLMGHVYAHPFYHFWEALIRLVTWIIFALLLAKLKDALAHADERFVTVLEGLDAAVYVAGNIGGELLYTNERCRSKFGVDGPLTHARQIEAHFQPRPADVGRGESFDPLRKRWYWVHSREIRWVDGRSVLLRIATDVTERKQAEELSRQQQEKLQLTSRLITVGEMASTLAHELNQPLAAIANYTMGCVRRLRSGNWNVAELLGAMEKSSAQAERAGTIIQRARELVRRREPHRVPCDLNAVIVDLAAMIQLATENDHVRLVLDLDPNLPAVIADRVMIEQAILNLTRNATEAMRNTPVDQRELVIHSLRNQSQQIEIRIVDRGCGIPAALGENLFGLFFTTKPEGMGMGLNICRSIAEFHDGRLWASRNTGAGSTFHLALPLSKT